jgi:hypothetical protein
MREGVGAEGQHDMENQRYSIAMTCAGRPGEHAKYTASKAGDVLFTSVV